MINKITVLRPVQRIAVFFKTQISKFVVCAAITSYLFGQIIFCAGCRKSEQQRVEKGVEDFYDYSETLKNNSDPHNTSQPVGR